MTDKRILYVTQEITPYMTANPLSTFGKELPQGIQRKGYEVRIFMPKYGAVNERRNQLHEVIRLSGVNIMINDNDHPLIIKVASLQPSRIQIYFIDNDDYFQKSADDADSTGSNRADNDERSIFFSRGTMETAKKLRWDPTVIHCTGVATALTPAYLKSVYADDPSFKNSKVVYSVTADQFTAPVDPEIFRKLAEDGVGEEFVKHARGHEFDTNLMHRLAIANSDAVIFHTEEPDPELLALTEELGLPHMHQPLEQPDPQAYADFYASLTD